MDADFNNKVRQLLLLALIIALALLLMLELYQFTPGLLGALTLYILSRDHYLHLVRKKNWKPGLAAFVFMALFLLCIGLPIYLAIDLLSSRVNALIHNQQAIVASMRSVARQVSEWTGQEVLSDSNIVQLQQQATRLIPKFLNSSMMIIANLAMMMFLAYFMFTGGIYMEKSLKGFIPLENRNINILAKETKNMIRANAIGIPVISIIQGLVAMLGYWLFGVKDFVLWGFLTGIFAFFPVVGTMIIWVPIAIYVFSTGDSANGIKLTLYGIIVIGNVDYLARMTLLKKIGDVHPVITVLGVIAGLQLFGFWGFIFGPLLVSYSLLLFKIYYNEFGSLKKDNKDQRSAGSTG